VTDVVLRRFCEQCQAYREPHEIKQVGPERVRLSACAICGGVLRTEQQRIARPLTASLLRAYAYPALPAIAVSTVVAALTSAFAAYVPLIGGLLSATIVIAFVFLVLRASAEGRDDLAIDTEVAERLSEWFAPLIRYLLTWLVSFSGALVALFVLGPPAGPLVAFGLGLVGLLYLPAGLIVAAHGDGCLSPINPVPAVRIIGRIPGPYAVALGFLLLTSLVGFGLLAIVQRLIGGIALVGPLVLRVLGLATLVVMARQLGVLVHEHREEL